MAAKQLGSSPPSAPSPKKRARLGDSWGEKVEDQKESALPSISKDHLPEVSSRGLTSDAQISKGEVLASQFTKQPVNIWYGVGRRTLCRSSSDCDEPDAPHYVDNAVQAKEQLQPQMPMPKPHYVARGGDDTSSSSDTEDGGDVYFQTPAETAVMAAPPSWFSPEVLKDAPLQGSHIPTGKNTTIAVLDSGINIEHSAFQVHAGSPSKISPHSKSFVGIADDITDRLGHGTQCAGLVCGSPDLIQLHTADERVEFSSIAPDARVMVCKVVKDGTAIADIQAVCNAIDHVISYNRQCETVYDKVDIISLSFGMEGFDHTLTNKIQEAVYDDIVVICAASNNGRRVRQPITYPARLGHVLCIGACTANGKPADFSPVGRELDFLAVGEGAWAPTVGGASAYCIANGTSFAAPLVAGIVCQLIEDLRRLSEGFVGEGPPLWQRVHNVWCMRELLKEMAAVQGKHCEESGFGALNPMEYFNKDDREKLRIITEKILNQ